MLWLCRRYIHHLDILSQAKREENRSKENEDRSDAHVTSRKPTTEQVTSPCSPASLLQPQLERNKQRGCDKGRRPLLPWLYLQNRSFSDSFLLKASFSSNYRSMATALMSQSAGAVVTRATPVTWRCLAKQIRVVFAVIRFGATYCYIPFFVICMSQLTPSSNPTLPLRKKIKKNKRDDVVGT